MESSIYLLCTEKPQAQCLQSIIYIKCTITHRRQKTDRRQKTGRADGWLSRRQLPGCLAAWQPEPDRFSHRLLKAWPAGPPILSAKIIFIQFHWLQSALRPPTQYNNNKIFPRLIINYSHHQRAGYYNNNNNNKLL